MEFLIYLLKVNIAIVVFYALYRFVFQEDTFFVWKRMMLLSMIAFSLFYPLIEFYSWFVAQFKMVEESELYAISLDNFTFLSALMQTERTFSFAKILSNILLISYLAGAVYCLLRLVVQALSIVAVLKNSEKRDLFGHKVLVNQNVETPFSFFGKIVISDKNYSESELREILLHEETHKQQWHSIDVLLCEALCVMVWFNPFVWQLKREIRLNLEFLADRRVLLQGCEAEHYQLNLLKISYHKNITSITNNFNFSFLKKRILMMKKKNSKSRVMLKYALLLPVIASLVGVNVSVNAENGRKLENWVSETAETLTNVVMPPPPQTKKATVQFTPPKIVAEDNSQGKTYVFKTKAGTVTLSGMADEPIYVLNGKIVSKAEMPVDAADIGEMGAIGSVEAMELYGEKGKNGAFFITLTTSDLLKVRKESKINVKLRGENLENVLYILDGKEITYEEFTKISEQNIDAISIWKEKSATDKYGEKGKNGVVEITLKKK